MKILTLNCGSSSAKYMVYDWAKTKELCRGIVERVGIGNSFIKHSLASGNTITIEKDCPTHHEAIELIINTITHKDYGVVKDLFEINGVGHRVVHGGEYFKEAVLITDDAIKKFEELSDLAPLHNPPNVAGIKAARKLFPNVPHVAVLDTAFLQTLPDYAYLYAVPYEWYEKYKIRKYGFHGTSHYYVTKRASQLLNKKMEEVNLITCHIGNGVSLTAVKNGNPVEHSMGFTPLEGLIMGTRSGDIDPAIIQYVMRKENLTIDEIIDILNKKSGILGITGKYIDRRDILKAMDEGDYRAELAFKMECHRLKKYIGAYIAVLGKVDAIVFTAGVGERSWRHREKVLEGLEPLGIKIAKAKNKESTGDKEMLISSKDSKIKVFVIPTNEEIVFVEEVVKKLDVQLNLR